MIRSPHRGLILIIIGKQGYILHKMSRPFSSISSLSENSFITVQQLLYVFVTVKPLNRFVLVQILQQARVLGNYNARLISRTCFESTWKLWIMVAKVLNVDGAFPSKYLTGSTITSHGVTWC